MHILVTGVKGALGWALAAALVDKGYTVRGAGFSQVDIPGVACVAADMADHDVCIALGEAVDVIVHLGAYHGVNLPRTNPPAPKTEREFFDANVASTFYLLRSAVENNVSKFVWASSSVGQ